MSLEALPRTSTPIYERAQCAPVVHAMNTPNTLRFLTITALGAGIGLGGYLSIEKSAWPPQIHFAGTATAADRVPLYYRDPSGAPRWSGAPKKDSQSRDYLPVYNEE